ncbi:NTE family protein [Rhodoblastus acidophilus]|nr:NTE family protein [Rhodoblastus acidophilus]
MLFHLGCFVRLNELGLLPRLERVASVSGGSIAAGALAVAWPELQFDAFGVAVNFREKVATPLLALARWRLDAPVILLGLLPFIRAANLAAAAYDHVIFKGRTLQDLPDRPRFVFTATSLQTGVLWRFAKEYAAEWRVGEWRSPTLPVSLAVGASASFPPLLSPVSIKVPEGAIGQMKGTDLHFSPFTTRLLLTDGGVYDNLGLEPIWKRYRTILVSDGGLVTPPLGSPWTNWLSQARRVTNIALQQGINMRVRVLRGLHASGEREVVYWGVGEPVENYGVGNPLEFSSDSTKQAASVATRLTRFPNEVQDLMMKAGYAQADAALRASKVGRLNDCQPDFSRLPLHGK